MLQRHATKSRYHSVPVRSVNEVVEFVALVVVVKIVKKLLGACIAADLHKLNTGVVLRKSQPFTRVILRKRRHCYTG